MQTLEMREGAIILPKQDGGHFAVEWPGPAEGALYENVVLAARTVEAFFNRCEANENRTNYSAFGRTEMRRKEAHATFATLATLDKQAFNAWREEMPKRADAFNEAAAQLIPSYERQPWMVHIDLRTIDSVSLAMRRTVAAEAAEKGVIHDARIGCALVRLPNLITGIDATHVDAVRNAVVRKERPQVVDDFDLCLQQWEATGTAYGSLCWRVLAHASMDAGALSRISEPLFNAYRRLNSPAQEAERYMNEQKAAEQAAPKAAPAAIAEAVAEGIDAAEQVGEGA